MKDNLEKLVDALLYEGYALFPYRRSALKNRKRFNFGVVAPRAWAARQTNEHFAQQTRIFGAAAGGARVSFRTRFLQLAEDDEWQTAHEREMTGEVGIGESRTLVFEFAGLTENAVAGARDVGAPSSKLSAEIEIATGRLAGEVFYLNFALRNLTALADPERLTREAVLPHCFVAAHTLFSIDGGEFYSAVEPPANVTQYAENARHEGLFPVLVGDRARRSQMLASPIILPDFPEAAEASFANFFDGLEIDELMALNLLALSDEEKREIRATDERTRRMLDKLERASAEDLLALHARMTRR